MNSAFPPSLVIRQSSSLLNDKETNLKMGMYATCHGASGPHAYFEAVLGLVLVRYHCKGIYPVMCHVLHYGQLVLCINIRKGKCNVLP